LPEPSAVRAGFVESDTERAQLLATIDGGGKCGRPPARLGSRRGQSIVSARAAATIRER